MRKPKLIDKRENPERIQKTPKLLRVLCYFRIPIISTIIELIYWKTVDAIRRIKAGKNNRVHLYGIKCFVGGVGMGKTMSLVRYLERVREKFGDKVLIATNFFYKHQDFAIDEWKVLLKTYDKPVVFAYDELQNEFNSRKYQTFPIPLMQLLTQNRKKNGKQIVYTAQDFETVDKNFRRLTTEVTQCRTFFGRLGLAQYYTYKNYQHLMSTVSIERQFKIRPKYIDLYVQSDYMRELYDSYQVLECAVSTEYLGIQELNQASQS